MFKTDYMALLIAANLYDTAVNAIEDCGKDQKIAQIRQFRERTGAGLKFCRDVIEAVHTHHHTLNAHDAIQTIYLAEFEEYERKNAVELYKNGYEPPSSVVPEKKEEEVVIIFDYNDFPSYHAKSIEEAYRVRELILNLNGEQPTITGIYKKIF